jgi:uncharacterized protein (TIGR02246 family)
MRVASEHAAHANADERALMTALQGLLDDPDGGMEGVNVALARFPDDAHIQYMAGVLNFQAGNYDAAEAALERAIAAEPTMGGAHNILGYVRLEQEDHPGAEAALREYIRLNPGHANPYDSLGEFYLRTGRLDEAETQLAAALERDPEFAPSLNNLAWVHIERAAQAYEQAVTRGDAAAIAALHTPGTVVMPPGTEAVRGRDAVASMWRHTFESGGASLELETDEVIASGNIAYEVGRSTYTPTGGPDFPGKFMAVWVRQEGVWLLHRDIWNGNSE